MRTSMLGDHGGSQILIKRLKFPLWSRSPGRAVEAKARHLLRDLNLQLPLDLDELCLKLGEKRMRPIQTLEFCFPDPSIFGLWVEATDTDIIIHDANLPPRQRTRTILHEVGHMVFDHEPDNSDDDVAEMIAPHLPPDTTWRCLRRDRFDSPHENDAEHFAALLQYWGHQAEAATRRSILGGALENAVDIF
ncbi:ImmA/IrrE family metallo-endopeptidase [Pseudonocardia sp. ICBG1293]|uniref:ImmA/IrrE family metallo-endopeptidase n=1 Tax=Pseudonocardia sp. ICBG1293 TaxID=2844382 RepID=UPI001CCE0C73|nr:ImmA/IrrE family metallo-endopeptidase [Pseudonocardia sp. ICBG1293]